MIEDFIHKTLASPIRRELILSLSKKEKYLSELAEEVKRTPQTVDFHLNILYETGLVDSETREGKKYYFLKDRKILEFLRHDKPFPAKHHPKPPHEIVEDMWKDMKKRLDKIEKRLENIEKKI